MVHYIRFLKTPLLSKPNPKECHISALITITTDLGDALFTKNTSISVYIHPIASTAAHGKSLQTARWTSKSRVLAISINVIRSQLQLPARLFVTSTDGGLDDVVAISSLPGIVPAWSAPFNDANMKQAGLLVERRLKFPDRGSLTIWEETGDSIARHIWDSGPPFLAYLDKVRRNKSSIFNASQRTTPLMVIELGSGCGVVGIGLAQLVSDCDILLTDLPEAQDILNRNIDCSKPAKGSRVSSCDLDWEKDLPRIVTKRRHDVILVSDCTYNTNSIPALVETLSKLTIISPNSVVYLATKVRHDSEAIFFTLMNDAQFSTEKLTEIALPNLASSYDEDQETVEVYEFRMKTSSDDILETSQKAILLRLS